MGLAATTSLLLLITFSFEHSKFKIASTTLIQTGIDLIFDDALHTSQYHARYDEGRCQIERFSLAMRDAITVRFEPYFYIFRADLLKFTTSL